MEGYFIFQWGQLFFRWGEASLLSRVGCPMEGNRLWWGWVQKNHKMRGGAPHAPPPLQETLGGRGEGVEGAYSRVLQQPPNPPAAKFVSEGDAHMRTDAQIKFLYYPLDCFTKISLKYTENSMDNFFWAPNKMFLNTEKVLVKIRENQASMHYLTVFLHILGKGCQTFIGL